jgi:hypothetical protein
VTNQDILKEALTAKQQFGLSPQDAFIYASVMSDIITHAGEKFFLNRNSKDFGQPDIEDEFSNQSCKMLWSFDSARYYR